MTQSPNRLCRSRSATQEFLVCKTDLKPGTAPRPPEPAAGPAVDMKELSQRFPGMLSGDAFIDAAMPKRKGSFQNTR